MDDQYQAEYEEIQCIGRGNFGAAYLVKSKVENKEYIAKKILLGQLQQKEQEGAMLEVNLLKNLSHPNIVSYKTSIISHGLLVIIMEYCDVGDLSYHIKRKLQKGERFTETEIFNWFVQICLALEYVHGRKVLHRDIKSQNIFLTGNNTVKLGDFGISKVLENTNNVAMTVVGTPYYMSPEVCQNQPYTYKSDVWALGCVLYELCTLKHAFSADNLLGLVYKIVQDKYEPIPSAYSKDLQNLINTLLNKNAQERPSVAQILQMPIVRQKMVEFVKTGGQTLNQQKQIFVKNTPVIVQQDVPPLNTQNPVAQIQQPYFDDSKLTPKERMQRKKEEEIRRKTEEATQAARNAHQNYQKASERKFNELYAGSSQQNMNFDKTVIHNQQATMGASSTLQKTAIYQPMPQAVKEGTFKYDGTQIQGTQKFQGTQGSEGFDANDRTYDYSESSIGTQLSYLTLEQSQSYPQSSQNQNYSPSKFNNPYNTNDDRQITGKGAYDLTVIQPDFEIEDDFNEYTQAIPDKQELNAVVNNYMRVLSGVVDIEEEQSQQSSPQRRQEPQQQVQVMGNKKQQIFEALGPYLFNQVHEFLRYHRRKGTDEKIMHGELKKMVNGNKAKMNHCFNLDLIVFMELQQE